MRFPPSLESRTNLYILLLMSLNFREFGLRTEQFSKKCKRIAQIHVILAQMRHKKFLNLSISRQLSYFLPAIAAKNAKLLQSLHGKYLAKQK